MINQQTRLCYGVQEPVLFTVYRTQRAITFWLLLEVIGDQMPSDVYRVEGEPVFATAEEVQQAMNSHADLRSVLDFGLASGIKGALVKGEDISPELTGRVFAGRNRVCLDQDNGLGAGEWVDHSHFVVAIANDYLCAPENRFIATNGKKSGLDRHLLTEQRNAHIHVHVPFASYNLEQCGLHMMVHQGLGAVANFTLPEAEEAVIRSAAWARPVLQLSGPSELQAGNTAQLTLGVYSSEGVLQDDVTAMVYLEAVSGYLPKTRLEVTGQTTFRVMALGLDAGDSIRVKAGFRHFPGAADLTISVV